MEGNDGLTIVNKIRNYQSFQATISHKLTITLEKAIRQARQQNKALTKGIIYHYDGRCFVCAINANVLQAYSVIYQMTPMKEYFEAIAYDPVTRNYHFYQEHFFKRYADRMKISHLSHTDILLHYIQRNPKMVTETSHNPHSKTVPLLTGMVKTGMIYGRMEAANVMYFRTIVEHRTLTKTKRRQTKKLRARFKRGAPKT